MAPYGQPKFRKGAKLPGVVHKDDYERIRWCHNTFLKYNEYWRDETARGVRNARFWWGVNFGQWPDNIVQRLLDQGRRPPTYNVVLDKMETMIGSIMGAGWNTRYEPLYGKGDSIMGKLDDIRNTDEQNLDWEYTETMVFLDALSMVGYERMAITDKLHDLGNITWEQLNALRVLRDPRWMSTDIDDLDDYFTYYYLTPSEVRDMCEGDVSEQLTELEAREKRDGIDFGYYEGFTTYDDPGAKWIDRHLVLEFHYVKREKVWWEYDKKNYCLFPETGFKYGSEQDKQAKAQYAQEAGLTGEDIVWDKKKVVTKYIERIAPTINRELFLARGKDRVQCGSVNLFPLGFQYQGQFQGIVDRIYDLQLSINRGEMSMDSILATTAKDTMFIDEGLAGGDPVKKAQIEDAWNMDGARIWVEEGAMADLGPNAGVIPLPHREVSADAFRVIERRYELADRLSKVPAAQESRTEGGQEPNILYENKLSVASIGQWLYGMLHKRHRVAKAKAYLRQAKITYAGAPREFRDDSGEPFTINKTTYDDAGQSYTLDDISTVPEMRVIAIPNKGGPSYRLQNQQQAAKLLPISNQDPNNRLITLILMEIAVDGEQLPDDKKDELTKAFALSKAQAALMIGGSIQGMQATMQQARAQANGMMQGGGQRRLGGPPTQPGAGVGADGEPAPKQNFRPGAPSQELVNAGTPKQEITA